MTDFNKEVVDIRKENRVEYKRIHKGFIIATRKLCPLPISCAALFFYTFSCHQYKPTLISDLHTSLLYQICEKYCIIPRRSLHCNI